MVKEFHDLSPSAEDKIVQEMKELRGAIEDLTVVVMGALTNDKVGKL